MQSSSTKRHYTKSYYCHKRSEALAHRRNIWETLKKSLILSQIYSIRTQLDPAYWSRNSTLKSQNEPMNSIWWYKDSFRSSQVIPLCWGARLQLLSSSRNSASVTPYIIRKYGEVVRRIKHKIDRFRFFGAKAVVILNFLSTFKQALNSNQILEVTTPEIMDSYMNHDAECCKVS